MYNTVGWGRSQAEPGFGASNDTASVKAKLIDIIASVRTVMRSTFLSPRLEKQLPCLFVALVRGLGHFFGQRRVGKQATSLDLHANLRLIWQYPSSSLTQQLLSTSSFSADISYLYIHFARGQPLPQNRKTGSSWPPPIPATNLRHVFHGYPSGYISSI